jgi:hypothetical protein
MGGDLQSGNTNTNQIIKENSRCEKKARLQIIGSPEGIVASCFAMKKSAKNFYSSKLKGDPAAVAPETGSAPRHNLPQHRPENTRKRETLD